MRRLLVGIAVTAAGLVPAALLAPEALASSAAKGKPPVKLSGRVNNRGTKVATGGSIDLEQDDEFYFRPSFVQIPQGTTSLTVTVKNTGHLQHTFTVSVANIDQVLNPGQSMVVTVPIPGKGALGFYCRFHKSRGMQGAFFDKKGAKLIKASGAASSGGSQSSGGSGY
jgi:plastocyanin